MARLKNSPILRWSALALVLAGIAVLGGIVGGQTGTATAFESAPALEAPASEAVGGGCQNCNTTSDCDEFCCTHGVRCDAGGCLCLDPY